jgi:mannitol 2-dehydrogenase
MTVALSLKTLADLPTSVGRPKYAREALSPGILHFGVGNFHRAHMAVYLDRLFNLGGDNDWAVVGAGVTASDARMRDALAPQDWLSTIVEMSAGNSSAHVTGVMTDFVPPMDAAAIIGRLADPAIRIVSMTVTEGGYFIDPATGEFDPEHPAIRADASSPDAPATVFGLILAGLRARRQAGHAPFTLLSCDNVPHNGAVARNAVAGLAGAADPAFAAWVRDEVAFPNGMVDRIATATGERERRMCREDFGVEDAWPVFCEDFIQWVVEDRFPAGRPALERVGVTFVDDVTPFEHMKIRILNGGHAVIAYPAGLMGIHFVHEAMEDPLVRGFLETVEREEILPAVPPVPGVVVDDYLANVMRRFSNPKIGDTVRRLCFDGSNRQPKFIVSTITNRLERGLPVEGLALASALWCRYCAGTTDAGEAIEPNDPNWDRLNAAALAARNDPASWLAMQDVYGRVGGHTGFAGLFAGHLAALWHHGTEAVLRGYLNR